MFTARAGSQPGTFILDIDMTDESGERYRADFTYVPGDISKLSSVVRQWLSENPNFPRQPYAPRTADQLRASLPPLSRRQLLRVLKDIGITEASIDASLADDEEGMIDWKNAGQYERLHALVVALADHHELPPEQVDALWNFGLTI